MDHMFQRFEECFGEIVEHLDACGIDAHRRRDGNRRPEVEAAHSDPIDRTIPAQRQLIYEKASEEEFDEEPPWSL